MTSKIQDTGVEKKSNKLEGKRIAFAICGGIGAVESIRSIRELRRHGANIFPYLSPSALEFVTELSVSWAAGKPAVTRIGSQVEHLLDFDGVVVAPTTLNMIAKAASAITDDSVSLLLAVQIARKIPVGFVPTMNEEMALHPAYLSHKKMLSSWGAHFFEGKLEEHRLKMPDPESLADFVIQFSK